MDSHSLYSMGEPARRTGTTVKTTVAGRAMGAAQPTLLAQTV